MQSTITSFVVLVSGSVQGQVLASWNTNTSFPITPVQGVSGEVRDEAAGVDAFDLVRGAGARAVSSVPYTTAFNQASLADAIATDDYVEFAFDVQDGLFAAVSSIDIQYRRSTSSNAPMQLAILVSDDGYSSFDILFEDAAVPTSSSFQSIDVDTDLLGGSVQFRIYAFDAGAGLGGNLVLDSFGPRTEEVLGLRVNGAVLVPAPASAALLGLAGLVGIRRR